jgi:hypothetical protein
MYSSPFRRSPRIATFRARLACLIHAANVHSEPGSNPSIVVCYPPSTSLRSSKTVQLAGFEPRPSPGRSSQAKARNHGLNVELIPGSVLENQSRNKLLRRSTTRLSKIKRVAAVPGGRCGLSSAAYLGCRLFEPRYAAPTSKL